MAKTAVGMKKDSIEKKATKGPSLWQYKRSNELKQFSDVELAVDFLHWASKKFPRRPVPTTHIVRVALNRSILPKEDSETVETFRTKRMDAVKKLAIKVHGRPVIPVPGMGWRMATTDEDVLTAHVERVNRRLISTIRSHDKAMSLVDPKKLHSQRHKDRYSELQGANKKLTGNIMKVLLPDTDDIKPKKK